MPFETIVGKVENSIYQHFHLLQQFFQFSPRHVTSLETHFNLLSANAFNLDPSKILLFGNRVNLKLPGKRCIKGDSTVGKINRYP